jgi:putative ABC transport system substrate-binding protein
MRRRTVVAGLLATPATSHAQQAAPRPPKQMQVVGFLGATSPEALQTSLVAFHRGLAETGHVEGRNMVIEYRWAQEHYDRLPALAIELVERNVSVIVAATLPSALAAKAATTTKPVIFFSGGDPVEQGSSPASTAPAAT